ncbi:hypothetical protein AMJ49_01100 [Parcubacteria bacterium DG_74_2]|nr:MAG: hypothetical protein AMJ49_01100 [Parcubacteria bacterium DG_74_2]
MKKKRIPKIKISDLKLIGKRIILRPLQISDAKEIYLNIQDKRIAQNTLKIPWPYKLNDAKSFIRQTQKSRRKKSNFAFGIELKDKKEVIGCISLDKVNFEHENAEIGYWLGSKHWNQGIMTEAGKLLLNFAFKKLKLRRVYGCAFSENPASQKVFEKLGFKKEGLHRQDRCRFGHWRDSIHYGLLVKEFFKK